MAKRSRRGRKGGGRMVAYVRIRFLLPMVGTPLCRYLRGGLVKGNDDA